MSASFGVFFHDIKCNGTTSFMEFMSRDVQKCKVQLSYMISLIQLFKEVQGQCDGVAETVKVEMLLSSAALGMCCC